MLGRPLLLSPFWHSWDTPVEEADVLRGALSRWGQVPEPWPWWPFCLKTVNYPGAQPSPRTPEVPSAPW